MGTKNYTLDSFARDFPRDVRKHAEAMMIGFHEGMDEEAGREFKRWAEKVRDTGTLSSRMGSRRNGRDKIPAGPASNRGRIKIGTKTGRINDAGHASAIDAGRKRNHYKNFSRLGGSAQAPDGISRPTKEHVLNQAERLGAEAIKKADAAFGRR